MKSTGSYAKFISDLKNSIINSRYQAARLVNKEQLVLYFKIGEMLSKKIEVERWGRPVANRR